METQLWMLDYGYKVRVINGKNKNKEGYLVYCSRFGDVCIDTKKLPDGNYKIREFPLNLEILSMDNPFDIKDRSNDLSNFDVAKLMLSIYNPKIILENQKYFNKQEIECAESSIKN